MKASTQRAIFRWIHILFGMMMVGYIYGPPEEVLQYRDNFRFVFFPVVFISGLWMWKGHWVTRLFSKGSA